MEPLEPGSNPPGRSRRHGGGGGGGGKVSQWLHLWTEAGTAYQKRAPRFSPAPRLKWSSGGGERSFAYLGHICGLIRSSPCGIDLELCGILWNLVESCGILWILVECGIVA